MCGCRTRGVCDVVRGEQEGRETPRGARSALWAGGAARNVAIAMKGKMAAITACVTAGI